MGTPCSGDVSSAHRTTIAVDRTIAFDRYGDGRPVILIGGAYNDRSTVTGVADHSVLLHPEALRPALVEFFS